MPTKKVLQKVFDPPITESDDPRLPPYSIVTEARFLTPEWRERRHKLEEASVQHAIEKYGYRPQPKVTRKDAKQEQQFQTHKQEEDPDSFQLESPTEWKKTARK